MGLALIWLGAAAPCPPVGMDADDDIAPLPHIGASLKPGTLELLAVGLATPAAAAAPGTPGAPPRQGQVERQVEGQAGLVWQAARALEGAVPGLHVNVTMLGRRGMAAADLLGLLRAELPKKPYRLVLWQTGTVEAVDELPPDEFYQTLADGAAAVTAAAADLVLIDPQYSRFLAANANLEPYQSAMQAAAALPGVALFHRFDVMRDWAGDGTIDLERAARADRPAVAARLHLCLGRELARELAGARAAGR